MASKERFWRKAALIYKRSLSQPAALRPAALPQQTHPARIIRQSRRNPGSLTSGDLLQLQRTLGNRFVGRLIAQTASPERVQKKANKTGMPDELKAGVEALSGLSMDDVHVHYNSAMPAGLEAAAYTQGADIYIGAGQEEHLPHEAWHAAQQKQGRVSPTQQIDGASVNADPALELEASIMGARAGALRQKEASGARRDAGGRAGQPVIQRVIIKLSIDGKVYDADYDNEWAKITAPTGKFLFVHKKSIQRQGQVNEVKAYLVPYIKSWFEGSLILYRGVNVDHVVYPQAKRGRLPAKPDATEEIPGFTSDSSTTKFIPCSTSRDIAVMASKTNPREDADHQLGVEAAGADADVGVVVRLQVGTANSVGMIDPGEVQVLDPPVGHVSEVKGQTLQHNFRLDRGALDAASILHHLHERLDDPMWSNLGKGFFGSKTPTGVALMKEALARGDWRAVLQIAKARHATPESNRHPETADLYATLAALANKVEQQAL